MATTADRSIFVDTNVLVYASVEESPLHDQATAKLQHWSEAGAELWISSQVLREFLVNMTRPKAFKHQPTLATLVKVIRHFMLSFRIAYEAPRTVDNLLMLTNRFSVQGKQIHDANIVATMMTNGVGNLLTHNVTDFKRYASLITVIPLVD